MFEQEVRTGEVTKLPLIVLLREHWATCSG